MLIPCPSCGQNNPPNAKQCLHCNHQLTVPAPGGFNMDNMAASISDAAASNSPKYQIAGLFFLVLFAAVFIYGMMNGRETICLERGDRQGIAKLESQGYTCSHNLFARDRDKKRARGVNHRPRDMCCVAPEEQKPQP